MNNNFLKKIAYLSLEFGLNYEFKTYAGGLGILAGDTFKTAVDLDLDFCGITLLYKKGYFKQDISSNGEQLENEDKWEYSDFFINSNHMIEFESEFGMVHANIWYYEYQTKSEKKHRVYFLDTDLEENHSEVRFASYNLYTPFEQTRLIQEMVLGIGAVKLIKKLEINIDIFHLNESHACFAIPALAIDEQSLEKAKDKIAFTTHTPARHGHKIYQKSLLEKVLAQKYLEVLNPFFDSESNFDQTLFCIKNSKKTNAVSKIHKNVTEKLFPSFKIESITNGIHTKTWATPSTQRLFDEYFPQWKENPSILKNANSILTEDIFEMHRGNKISLIDLVESKTGIKLDVEKFTIGFGRRVDSYKRPDFIFRKIEILRSIAKSFDGIQIIISGKAYFNYLPAEKEILEFINLMKSKDKYLNVIYLENYDMIISEKMVSGADIWLNNPQKPLEACGTSGMKASLNANPNFSTLDGWWAEACQEGINGWSIGDNSDIFNDELELYDLYSKLQYEILPLFYNNKYVWANIQKNSIATIVPQFNSDRMLREYFEVMY